MQYLARLQADKFQLRKNLFKFIAGNGKEDLIADVFAIAIG